MIIPVLHRILVKQDKLEEKDETFKSAKAAGIVFAQLNEAQREQAAVDTGKVVAIGGTAFKDFGTSSPIEAGDYVVFARHAGKIVKDNDGTEYVALNDEDIICKIVED
jgi:co-chaperonin GroES (HSP10)